MRHSVGMARLDVTSEVWGSKGWHLRGGDWRWGQRCGRCQHRDRTVGLGVGGVIGSFTHFNNYL